MTYDDLSNALDRSPARWDAKSERLWQTAALIQERGSAAAGALTRQARTRGVVVGSPLHAHQEYVHVAAMLRAMSIEDLLKAIYYNRQLKAKGSLRDCKDHKKHDLLYIATDLLQLSISESHAIGLHLLTSMIFLGRYPANAKRVKGQIVDIDVDEVSDPVTDAEIRGFLLEVRDKER